MTCRNSPSTLTQQELARLLADELGWPELSTRQLARRHQIGLPMPPRHGGGSGRARVYYERREVASFVAAELARTRGRLSAADAARECGVEPETLRLWAKEQPPFGPPRHKDGLRCYYYRAEVDTFVRSPRQRTGSWLSRFANIPPSQRRRGA